VSGIGVACGGGSVSWTDPRLLQAKSIISRQIKTRIFVFFTDSSFFLPIFLGG
jgi:hypothetical protein